MNDLTLYSTAEAKQRGLNRRFVVAGLISILLIVSALTAGAYFRLQENAIGDMARRISAELQEYALSDVVTKTIHSDPSQTSSGAETSSLETTNSGVQQGVDAPSIKKQIAAMVGRKALRIDGIESVALFDAKGRSLWQSSSELTITAEQRPVLTKILQGHGKTYASLNHSLLKTDPWLEALTNNYPVSELLVAVRFDDSRTEIAKVVVDFRAELSVIRQLTGQLLSILAISTTLLFLLLFFIFRRGIQTINEQEERLNEQITRLSKLLTENKGMQRSMKTASARAVELNEQFLRRVGADLHDGPAQMIGFATMRLAQVSNQEAAKEFGHEFHAVRQALDESLEEIRGISSGLVLPELEKMSLEECLRKVVTLHGTKSDIEVAQYYQDLTHDIPLPIKITAYRFIQEGLNNAHRHGHAKKCRLNAFVKGDVLHLSLKDNGKGFRKSTLNAGGGHLGLLGLKDRIESLGGRFSINSELGIGTALKLSISLKDDS